MSSLFKHSWNGKQLKEFTELAMKTLPNINNESAKYIFKSIKNGTNASWNTYELAIEALKKKLKLNIQIMLYKKIINDKQTNRLREVQSAKQHLIKLTMSPQITQLIYEIERGFNLAKGSLSPRSIAKAHLHTTKKKRSVSVTKNCNEILSLEPMESLSKNSINSPNSINNIHSRSSTDNSHNTVNTINSNEFNDENKSDNQQHVLFKQRSKSPMALDKVKKSSPKLKEVPSMNTKEYLQFLLERAVTNKTFNDNDLDRLCKCAISMKCDWITVHSMWVTKCLQLLNKYTMKEIKAKERVEKKNKRRGSKISLKINDKLTPIMDDQNNNNNESKESKSDTKICVTIGYPLGQTSTVSKVAETRQSVAEGAKRIRLMIAAGKVIMEDWDYIINEVKCVVSAANGADVRIVFPDTSQITENVKHIFNQKIMQGMAQKTPSPNSHESGLEGSKTLKTSKSSQQRKLPCTFSDDETSDDEQQNMYEPGATATVTVTSVNGTNKSADLEDSESSDDESSPSNLSHSSDDNEKCDDNLPRFLKISNHSKNIRRASTMTSLRKQTTLKKKRNKNNGMSDSDSDNSNSKTEIISQSVTDLPSETGAVSSYKKKKSKKKKRKKNKKTSNNANINAIQLKKDKKKDKRKRKRKKDKENNIKKKGKKMKSQKKDNGKQSSKKNNNKKKKSKHPRAKSVGRIK